MFGLYNVHAECKVQHYPKIVYMGDPVLVHVACTDASEPKLENVSLSWDGMSKEMDMQKPQNFLAWIGISAVEKRKKITLEVFSQAKKLQTYTLKIRNKKFLSEHLKVSKQHVNPTAQAILNRIALDRMEVQKAYAQPIKGVDGWKKGFFKPILSEVTSPFGSRRLYNKQLRNYHTGTDLRAAEGTPVLAMAAGKVVLAKDLFYTGNTMIVDHGMGIFSLYGHMKELRADVESMVEEKGLLGLSGATGRITGPHLHWTVLIHGQQVDPMRLLELSPKVKALVAL